MIGVPRPTVDRWVRAAQDTPSETIRHGWEEITIRAHSHIHRFLDVLEDSPDDVVLKQGFTLNALAGTAADKLRANAQPNQQNNFYQLVQAQVVNLRSATPPLTIDAEPQP